jgi:hypothetical protein
MIFIPRTLVRDSAVIELLPVSSVSLVRAFNKSPLPTII